MSRIPRKFDEIVESLIQGATPQEAAKFPADMTRVMSVCLDRLDMPWQTCVALCYVAQEYDELIDKPAVSIDPLAAFLASKDVELDNIEFENKNMTMLLKCKVARV